MIFRELVTIQIKDQCNAMQTLKISATYEKDKQGNLRGRKCGNEMLQTPRLLRYLASSWQQRMGLSLQCLTVTPANEMVSKQVLFRGPMITGGEQRRSAGKPYRHNCPGNRRFGLISKECSCNYALSWCRRGVLCIFLEHGEVVWLDESPRACAERLKQITCWNRMHDIARTFWKGIDDVRYWVLFLEITAEKLVGGGTI